ncbi:MAG: D-glycerate dehydrogenase [Candidatus Bathyarchaeota archaeon]|nr:D-glycerate dehydrogenase [Candidatus Bathyarchaeota archaeon]MDH5689577.1 D-glycerate dehydrogenase [Candidatus Bathyarchaeota archaeon]
MAKPKVLMPQFISVYQEAMKILRPVAEIEYMDREKYREQLAVAEGIIGWGITKEILAGAPKLRVVARYGVGYDDCDLEAMTRHEIYLCHTPGVLSDSVAEMAIALLMACNRKIVQADKYARESWAKGPQNRPALGVDLTGKTLGIIGMGRIGLRMAEKCVKGFEMRLIYHDIARNLKAEKELNAEFKSLDDVMKESDFISIHVALTPKTKGLIGEEQLRMMKKTAYIINTSRGAVMDQKALVKVLSEEAIAGAGLDVFEKEPVPLDDPILKLQNVVLAPHIGSSTQQAREAMAVCNAESIAAVLRGEIPPPNVVPEQKGMIFKKSTAQQSGS